MTLPGRRGFSWIPIATALGLALIMIFVFVDFDRAVAPERTPNSYVLPPGFSGHVKILYEVEDAEPLAIEDGFRVLPINASGYLETSSKMLYGHAEDRFLRRKPEGGFEELTLQDLKIRKNGLEGDQKEYFASATEELPKRDAMFQAQGRVDADGENILGHPYEIMVFRGDDEEGMPQRM
ncbi:hypothetical protein KQI84_09090 [bacterium]|nr:hypothetical protein [bacterium]